MGIKNVINMHIYYMDLYDICKDEKHLDNYFNFIESRAKRTINNIIEKHHIIPKSLGGNNDIKNIIDLTPREHYIAHLILWKAIGGKMTQAFWLMNNRFGIQINSREYSKLKQDFIIHISKPFEERFGVEKANEIKEKLSNTRKGKSWEEYFGKETAEKVRIKAKKRVGSWTQLYGNRKADKMKQKLSESQKKLGSLEKQFGIEKANKIREKMSNAKKGKSWNYIYGEINANKKKTKLSILMTGDNNPSHKRTPQQRKIIALKSAETIKRLGLLKGKNHPLYGKGHTEESKQKIKENHAPCGGQNNSRAKRWILKSPNAEIYKLYGTLKQFCIKNNLSLSMLKNNIGKKILTSRYKTNICLNTIGWILKEDTNE